MNSSSAGLARLEKFWNLARNNGIVGLFGLHLGSFEDAKMNATAWIASLVAESAGISSKTF